MSLNPQQVAAANDLKRWLQPGATVYTTLRHVSKSGMNRWIDFYTYVDNQPIRLTYLVALVCEYKYDIKREALKVQGGGMDMGFSVVYNLGCALWPTGTSEPHGTRNGEPDYHGGYALRHSWQ